MHALIECLSQNHDFPYALKLEIVRAARIHFYRPGTILRRGGELSDRIFFIRRGVVQAYRNTEGKKKTEWLASEKQFLCPFNRFVQKEPSGVYYETLELAEIFEIGYDSFLQLSRYPAFRKATDALVMKYLYHVNGFLVKNCGEAANRYRNFQEYFSPLMNRVQLHVIASLIDVCPKTISRIRNRSAKMIEKISA